MLSEVRALRDRLRELDERAAEVARERAHCATKLAKAELEITSDGPDAQRLRVVSESRPPIEPRRWRNLHEVQAEVATKRTMGSVISFDAPNRVPRVYVDGCFDMMHSGHMNAVRQAKLIANSVGGTLVVGVHSDAEIVRAKGPPVMREAERLALVAAVKWVDELIFDTPYSPTLDFLDSIDAEYVVHGDDIHDETYTEAKRAGRLKVVKRTEGVSTTDLVGRLLINTREHHASEPDGPPLKPVSASAASVEVYTEANVSSSGISQFLATTMRLRAFSNGRAANPGDRVVYVDGVFDLLHAGHVSSLYAARNRGDYLIVGLHSDASANGRRGQNQPIMSLHERALCTLALGCVDEVILGAPTMISADLLRTMNISLVVRRGPLCAYRATRARVYALHAQQCRPLVCACPGTQI